MTIDDDFATGDRIGRRFPAKGVSPSACGNALLWCTVCTADRGEWCLNPDVIDGLRSIWAEPSMAWLVGDFLLMPDHLHFFCAPAAGAFVEVERWTSYWKDRFTKHCGQRSWRWQRGVFHHRIRSEQSWNEKFVYMQHNPVRKGLVEDADRWPWKGRVHELRW